MSCIIYGPWASSIALYICNLYTINGLRIIFHIYQGISQTLTLALSFLPTSHPPPPPLHTHHHCRPHPLLQAATPSAAPIPQPLPPSPPPSPLAWSRRHGPGCRRPSRRYFSLSLSPACVRRRGHDPLRLCCGPRCHQVHRRRPSARAHRCPHVVAGVRRRLRPGPPVTPLRPISPPNLQPTSAHKAR
jgi:hypothetical protein